MSVNLSLHQRATSEEWCASPPLSVILRAAAVEDEGLAAVRARLRGAILQQRELQFCAAAPCLRRGGRQKRTPMKSAI
eukprot:scaffold51859_cov60-Phaeocystis_antarctica.AAC.1